MFACASKGLHVQELRFMEGLNTGRGVPDLAHKGSHHSFGAELVFTVPYGGQQGNATKSCFLNC